LINITDLHWLSEKAIEDRNFTLKSGAKLIEIKYWKGMDDGQNYEGNLRKFYNAADIVELDGTVKVILGNEETDMEYALEGPRNSVFLLWGPCILRYKLR
jgi:hypothetical protein